MKNISILFPLVVVFFSCNNDDVLPELCSGQSLETQNKIKGGSILQTWVLSDNGLDSINLAKKTNANWVSLSPIIEVLDWCNGSCRPYRFRADNEIEKMKVIIPKVVNSGLENIMLKPMTSFWEVNGSSFWGDFYVNTEEEWEEIEKTYGELFYEFARLSEYFPQIKILSLGTELKEFVGRRPKFFKKLISKIRTDFPDLKLTYSANWDEYQCVTFWEDLDYIGINPYFPLVDKQTPTIGEIEQALIPIKRDIQAVSCTLNKPVLFTEYGYRSIDYAMWKPWLLGEVTNESINLENQKNGYNAFYNTFWDEPWVAGGFFWEWNLFNNEINYPNNGWYINGKSVEKIILDRYTD